MLTFFKVEKYSFKKVSGDTIVNTKKKYTPARRREAISVLVVWSIM